MTIFQLLLAAALIVANGFFVAVEFALVAAPRPPLERMAETGNRRARLALAATGDLGRQLAGAQLGISLTSVVLGFVAESAIANILQNAVEGLGGAISHGIAGTIALILVVVLQMVFGEMIPKNASVAAPARMMLWLAPPHRLFVSVLKPIIDFVAWLGNKGVRALRVPPSSEVADSRTPAELASMLERSRRQGVIDDAQLELLSGALMFGDQRVDAHMVPRSEIVCAPEHSSAAELEDLVASSGHSRLPLFARDIDDSAKFVHAKDLLRLPADQRDSPMPSNSTRPLPSVGSDELLDDVFLRMQQANQHVALVLEEGGRVEGLITLEDILEALIGDFEDESDKDQSDH